MYVSRTSLPASVESPGRLLQFSNLRLKTGELEPWQHLVKLFGENSSVATLEGFLIHENKAALEAAYKSFLASHLEKQAENATPV